VRRLSAILRIADGLDRRHTDSVQSIAVKRRKNDIDMLIETAEGEDISLEIWGAERREQLFEEEFSVRVNLIAPVALASGGKG
jgi:exopolyphosphatase/guanosine-5'-triphosphate,3'-diphosphate pyrophosphatase